MTVPAGASPRVIADGPDASVRIEAVEDGLRFFTLDGQTILVHDSKRVLIVGPWASPPHPPGASLDGVVEHDLRADLRS